jgi:pimeloyl-ACP methyl ester carboxylesterase
MKKHLFIITLLFVSTQLTAQEITGDWQGQIPVNGKNLRLIFHIRSSNGQYSSTFDSPDQYALGLRCDKTVMKNDSLLIDIAMLQGGFYGKWDGKDVIVGNVQQGSTLMHTVLQRTTEAPPPTKPQTPKPPFNYFSEEVGYENNTQQVHLAGTFTRPNGAGRFPVILMITGSGAQDRDESIGLHKSFWVIADHLAKQGIAVLRVDDRGMGKSSGNFMRSSSADFATDVMAGIDYLKTRMDVDTTRMGLLGHSEGGMIAIYTAARRKDVAFIVSLAGPATSGAAINDFQNVLPLIDAGASQTMIDRFLDLHHAIRSSALSASDDAGYLAAVRQDFLNWKSKQDAATLQTLITGSDEAAIAAEQKAYAGFRSPWWRFFLTYDPVPDITKLTIPVLALNGGKDAQVEPKANLAAWGDALKKSGSPKFKTMEIEGLNHLFQHCIKCGSVEEYMSLQETFDPVTLQLLTEWVQEVVH